jgi:benzoylformate decarboxylase
MDRYWRDRGIETHEYPDAFDLSRPEINFVGLAQSMGVAALRVDKAEQVEGAVSRMLGHTGPFLIDLDTA